MIAIHILTFVKLMDFVNINFIDQIFSDLCSYGKFDIDMFKGTKGNFMMNNLKGF